MWEKQQCIAAPEVLVKLGPKHPLGLDRAMKLLALYSKAEAAAVRVKIVVACLMQRAEFYEGSRSLP